MESSKKQVGSSFSVDIFDSTKESTQPSNSTGIFSSLFLPPSKYKKEGGEYDSGGNDQYSASRGNWWEGVREVLRAG